MSVKFYQKLGHQLLKQNLVFMQLPVEIKGTYLELRLMVGDAENEDGSFPLGASRRATLTDLLNYFTVGEKSKRNFVLKRLNRLVAAGVMKVLPSGVVRLTTYGDEQALGRTPETYRKREEALRELRERAAKAHSALHRLFKHADSLPFNVVAQVIKGAVRCNARTLDQFVDILCDEGFLVVGEDGFCSLASLALPPGAEAGGAGAEPEYSGSRNIPPDSEPDKGILTNPQLDPAETRANARSEAGGGRASEASARRADSMSEANPVGCERNEHGRRAACDTRPIYSPEEAWTVGDPLHASELLLQGCAGWDDRSRFSLRARWKALRQSLGAKDADRVWRQALFDIAMDRADRASWRSFVAVFLGKVKRGEECVLSLRQDE